ncbi:MAG: ATP-binding cassette domain-containing protein [Sedimentisphaerales bacterium]|nr:ATP-binding cassette domain-containing protein [Sedimentisphaerales bacterium]
MAEMSDLSRWEKELSLFNEVLANPRGQAIVIVGPAGSGKSTLLAMMVMRGKQVKQLHCEGRIHHVGPNDTSNKVLRDIVTSDNGSLAFLDLEHILRSLSNSVDEFGDLHRRVIGIDANPTMPVELERNWLEIIPDLPPKVKLIFTQRPDDILATNIEFMGLPNVVRIDVEAKESGERSEEKSKDENQLIEAFIKFLVLCPG